MRRIFAWVLSGYFPMGLTSTMLVGTSTIMLKNIGLSNASATAISSLFYIAYAVKPFASPLVELFRSKKFFVLSAQLGIAACFLCSALVFFRTNTLVFILLLFGIASVLGMLLDTATDGVLVTSLKPHEQSQVAGFTSVCWIMGSVAASGAAVYVAGTIHSSLSGTPLTSLQRWTSGWSGALALLGVLVLIACSLNRRYLPPASNTAVRIRSAAEIKRTARDVFTSFFRKEGVLTMILFVFFYRFSEGFIEKIIPLFMIDSVDAGGLALGNAALGIINGVFGLGAFLVGSMLGGMIVFRFGLQASLLYLCCALNVPNLLFVMLAQVGTQNLYVVAAVVVFEKLFYGIGATGHMLYLMQQLSAGPYRTAHYAFGTGILTLCMWLTGAVSGLIESRLGYRDYFLFVLLAAVPSFYFTLRAPFRREA